MKLLILLAIFLPFPQIGYFVPYTGIATEGSPDVEKIDLVIFHIEEHLKTTPYTYCPRKAEMADLSIGILITYTFECYVMQVRAGPQD